MTGHLLHGPAAARSTTSDSGRPATPPHVGLRVGLMVEDFPVISETFVINMAAGLVERGHSVEVLVMSAVVLPIRRCTTR